MTVQLTKNLYRSMQSAIHTRNAESVCVDSWFILPSANNKGED